jgi:hypothetical protein
MKLYQQAATAEANEQLVALESVAAAMTNELKR